MLCFKCNERFSFIIIVERECQYCHKEKASKKFSKDNNIDLDKVPDELQDLTEIEKMLIVRVFPMISVYRLCKDQHGYYRNVINFSQDI